MTLNPTLYGDNPQQPSIAAEVYVPDQLIAGPASFLVTIVGTIGKVSSGAVNARGTLLGLITNTNKWIPCIQSANDGSQIPRGILVDQTDTTGGDVTTAGIYVEGEFNSAALTLDASWDSSTVAKTPSAQAMINGVGIVIKNTPSGLTQTPET